MRLADLEVRSREAAPFRYGAAVAEFDRVTATFPDILAEVDHEAWRIAIRLYPDEVREMLARDVLTRVALLGATIRGIDIGPLIPAEARMYLGRGFRKWHEGLASS